MSVLVARTLQSSGRAFAIGSVFGALATWGRMRGREDIEWKDRAWRILENKGEVQTDWVTLGGIGAGAFASAAAARRGAIPASVGSAMLGGAGAGSATGKHVKVSHWILVPKFTSHLLFLGIPFMIATFAMGRKPA
jgi:hypothetical protein